MNRSKVQINDRLSVRDNGGTDGCPRSLVFSFNRDEETERVYALLADGGQIFMPMQSTFFASRFAMLRDKFGTSWMLSHAAPRTA